MRATCGVCGAYEGDKCDERRHRAFDKEWNKPVKTSGQFADELKDIADQLSSRGDQWDYQANRLYEIAASLVGDSRDCPRCGKRMTYSAVAPIENAAMDWKCFHCVDLGLVSTNAEGR